MPEQKIPRAVDGRKGRNLNSFRLQAAALADHWEVLGQEIKEHPDKQSVIDNSAFVSECFRLYKALRIFFREFDEDNR